MYMIMFMNKKEHVYEHVHVMHLEIDTGMGIFMDPDTNIGQRRTLDGHGH
jgi:hypothetical protein